MVTRGYWMDGASKKRSHVYLSVVLVTKGDWIDETSKNGPELKEIKEVKSKIFVWLHFLSF